MDSKKLFLAYKKNVVPRTMIFVVVLVWNINNISVQAAKFRYSSLIINKFKERLCTMYSNKYSYCKDFLSTSTTEALNTDRRTTDSIQQNSAMISSTTVNNIELDNRIPITSPSTKPADEIKRSGVTVLENYQHAVMVQGPSDLRLAANNSRIASSQLRCATSCISSEWCLGVAFSRSKRFCQLMSDNVMQFGELVSESEWKLYFITPT